MNGTSLIHVTAMAECHDDDEKNSVVDRIDDSIITNSETVAFSPPEWSRGRWTRVLSKKCDGAMNSRLHCTINLSKFA